MAMPTNWKLIKIKSSLGKLAFTAILNTIQFHLEDEPKIKWVLAKKKSL